MENLHKQIIIDGVDVKKCIYHESGYCTISKEAYCYCCDKPNCHYKNWQRKEQECEELNADNISLRDRVGKLERAILRRNDKLDQLKMENEELKTMLKDLSYESQKFCYQIEEQTKQLEPFKDEYFKGLDNVVIAELAKKSIRITAENSKLEKTLTEIKEMLKEICMEECLFDWNKTSKKHCGDCDCRYGQILQKISECEVE
jgi:predicted RNase H-like nuclease (RuvC/YqgF family)